MSFWLRAAERASRFAAAPLALPFRPDQVYRVPTRDGAHIALARYAPVGTRRFDEPVILCHGLGANRYTFDFNPRYSLARSLAARGFEAWVLELRGRGLSGPCGPVTFDQQAEHDVGAALETVRSTGARAVTWVGHSKGGLLAYAHLARFPDAPIAALVAIGTPFSFGEHHGLKRFIGALGVALELEVIPLSSMARSFALLGLPPAPIGPYLARGDNMEPDIVRRAIANVSADVPGGVGRQFARWIREGTFDALDGSFDYRAGMAHIRAPALLVGGSHDLLAPPASVHAAARSLGGPCELLTLGQASGFKADYGHGDLILGRHSPEELYPRVAEFLAAHSRASPGASATA